MHYGYVVIYHGYMVLGVVIDILLWLLQQSIKRRFSGGHDHVGGSLKPPLSLSPNPNATSQILSSVPQNVQELLNDEEAWDFNIISLERLTNKQ